MSLKERESILSELAPPFVVHEPDDLAGPLVFSSPHSGRVYPRAFLAASRLPVGQLRKSEDVHVEELFADVTGVGAPLLAARFPRAYIDVNREPYELDPDLFEDSLPEFANTRSLKVVGGLGTIARVVADNEEIYGARLTVSEAFERIDRLYHPYHGALRCLVDRARDRFGTAILIDCHSMPSAGTGTSGGMRPHFVLGDRFGTSCSPALSRFVRAVLVEMGYEVAFNRPYAGGYITEHYGRPRHGVHALQIEINRALYMEEATLERTAGFQRLRGDLLVLAAELARNGHELMSPRAAAE